MQSWTKPDDVILFFLALSMGRVLDEGARNEWGKMHKLINSCSRAALC